jgi:hypothetical protein
MDEVFSQLNDVFETTMVSKCVIVIGSGTTVRDASRLCRLLRRDYYAVDEPYLCPDKDERVLARFLQHRSRMLVTSLAIYKDAVKRLVSRANLVVHI